MGDGLINHIPAIDVCAVTLPEYRHMIFQTLQQRFAGELFAMIVAEHPETDLLVPYGRMSTYGHIMGLGISDNFIRRLEIPHVLLWMDGFKFHSVSAS